MKVDKDVIALSILAAAETAHSYSSYMPSAFTLKSFALQGNDDEVRKKLADFRSGYLPATLWGLGLGAVVALVAESPLPFLFAAGTAGVMVLLYEQGIPPEKRVGLLQALRAGAAGALPCGYQAHHQTGRMGWPS